jgi:uridine kinase
MSPASTAAQTVITRIQRLLSLGPAPILVALDGASGAGKSTLASLIAAALDGTVVPSDDFYAAHIPTIEWEARLPQDRAADGIDWRRLRHEALEPLLAGKTARWQPFDFEAGPRADGTYPMHLSPTGRHPARLIILDGAYSARPELADLITLSVLVQAPLAVRHARLTAREVPAFLAAWHALWDEAEVYYFTTVRPPATFDLVVSMAE